MRLFAPSLVAAAALAAVWVEAAAPPTQPPPFAPAPLGAAERGLAAALAAAGAAPLPGLAAAAGEDGLWRLRGRAPRAEGPAAGWPALLYAEARPLCDVGLDRAACWRVDRLELAGAALLPAEAGR